MDILHLGKYYPPYHGGVETAMAAICEGLAEAGEAVTALVANDGPTAAQETRAGVAVTRMARTRVWFSQPICPALGPTLAASRQDILHVHLPNPLAAWHCLRRRPPGRWLALYHSDIVKQKGRSLETWPYPQLSTPASPCGHGLQSRIQAAI